MNHLYFGSNFIFSGTALGCFSRCFVYNFSLSANQVGRNFYSVPPPPQIYNWRNFDIYPLIIWILEWLLKLEVCAKKIERPKESSALSNISKSFVIVTKQLLKVSKMSKSLFKISSFSTSMILSLLQIPLFLVFKVRFTVVPQILYVVSFREFFFKICFLNFVI